MPTRKVHAGCRPRPVTSGLAATADQVDCGNGSRSLAHRRCERCIETLRAAVADDEFARQPVRAGVLARLEITDVPGSVVTLRLDREPPEVLCGAAENERPDLTLRLRSVDLVAMLRSGEHLPLQILTGRIRFEGALHRFLSVLPLLRTAVAAQLQDDGPLVGTSRRPAPVTPARLEPSTPAGATSLLVS